jgi:hypothetical protein
VKVRVLNVQQVELIYLIHVHFVVNDHKQTKIINKYFEMKKIVFFFLT